MLGTEKPSLNNNKKKTSNNNQNKTRSLSFSNTSVLAEVTSQGANSKNKTISFNSPGSNSSKHSSIHQFNYYNNNNKLNHIVKPKTSVVLMPKVYQLNFDENFVEKELINRNDGAHSRRGTQIV